MSNQSGDLGDAEIALMDAIKSVIEILMTAGIAKPAVFNRLFTHQRDAYLQKEMPTAAAVMEMLRLFAIDPGRAASRDTQRKVLEEPPQGSA